MASMFVGFLALLLPWAASVFSIVHGRGGHNPRMWACAIFGAILIPLLTPLFLLPMGPGPAFAIDENGLRYKGQYIPWFQINSIGYNVSSGKGSYTTIFVRLNSMKVSGPYFTKRSFIAVPVDALNDPNGFIAHANELLDKSQRQSDGT